MSSERFRERLLSGDQLALDVGGQLVAARAPAAAPVLSPQRWAVVDPPLSRSARWKPQNWRLRTKLTALTVVPLALALVLGGLKVADAANNSHSVAARDAVVIGAFALLALIMLVVLARSILKPLRVLRASAFDVADRRLPAVIELLRTSEGRSTDIKVEPVPVHSREDVGQVARAFDAVHSEAVRLAAEQAALRANVNDMFVNLSRRSQSLVERQLRLIDELEMGEQDSDRLASLFRLDHLATRMRRNGENLLVLAGADLRQRSGEPVALIDVLRAAVSEIEDYPRVALSPLPRALVSGLAVNDIVHLVAELLDNATAYSDPESVVQLSARLTGDNRVAIEIVDAGTGLPRPRMLEINQRLASPQAVDVSVSRQMGLFVVGRLANRHGISVRLFSEEGQGLTVTVTLPRELIVSQPFGAGQLDETPASAQPSFTPALNGDLSRPLPHASSLSQPYQEPARKENSVLDDLSQLNGNTQDTPIFHAMLSRWFTERQGTASIATEDTTVFSGPLPEVPPAQDDWVSEADEGWQAAEVASEPVPETVTASGLPKRRPGAFLVPGSVGATMASEAPASSSARDAETIRGRVSDFQRGLTLGRHTRPPAGPDQRLAGDGYGRHVRPGSGIDQLPDDHDEPSSEGTR